MRRSVQSPAKDSAARRSARNSMQYVANFQGRSSTSYQEGQGPQFTSTPRRSLGNSQQNGTKIEGQSSMFQQPAENYDDEINSRKNSLISPRIRELLKELEEARRVRKYNFERENIRCSQQLAPGLQVMMNLGLVHDTRLTSVDQKLKCPETSNNITSETEEESPEAPESSEIGKTSEKSEASEIITLEYSETSETPEPYEITTSEYPDTSDILESSETPQELYISRRPEMPRKSVISGRHDMPRKSVISGRSDIPRIEMPRKSFIPVKSGMPSSDMPRTSVISGRSDMPRTEMLRKSVIPGKSGMPKTDKPRSSIMPGRSDMPRCSKMAGKANMPRKSGIPVRLDMPRKSVIPGRSDMPRKSVIPGRSDMPRKSVIPGRSDIPRKSNIPGRSEMSRKSVIPGRSDIPRKSVIPGRSDTTKKSVMSGSDMPRKSVISGRSDKPRSDMPRKSVISGRSDMSRTDVPKKSVETGRSDMPKKSVETGRSDMPKKSVETGRSDMPRSDMFRKSVLPGISDMPRKSVIPRRSDTTRRREMPGSSIMSGGTDILRKSDKPGKTDMPRSSVMLERSDISRRSDMEKSSVIPEKSQKWEERSSAGSEEILYSDSESTASNISYQPSDTSIHRRQSRVSRVGSILEIKVIDEGKTSPKDLRQTIGYSQDSKPSILNRVMANWDMDKSRYSEDRSAGQLQQFVDNTIIDWNTVKDPRRKSIKPIQVDSPPRVNSELSRYIGSLLHVVMAGWNSQESKEKIEELLSPKANWSYESLRSEIISLLSETLSDGQILEHEQERRLKELKEDLQLEESTPYQGENIRFSQFKKKVVQETPKTPQRKRKRGTRFTPGPMEIPKNLFARQTPANEEVWLTQVPKVQRVLSFDSEQSSFLNPVNASSMRGSVLYKDKRAMRRNESYYTDTQEGSSEIDNTKRAGKTYVPPFDVTPPIWTHPDFYKNPENRSMLISTRIEQIQRQQKTLSDIQKAQARQSTISGNVSPSYGHGSMYMQQNMAHSPYPPTPISGRNVKTGYRTPMRILPEDFKDCFTNDTELRDSVDFEFSTPTPTDDIEFLESDLQWEEAIADPRDSYLDIEDMIAGRTDSYTEDEGTESEQTDVHLETEIPVTPRRRTNAVPEKTVSSSQNVSIVAEKISPIRKPTIPESEYNIRMKLLPAFAPIKKTVVQARSKNDKTESARQASRAKSPKIKYETISTTVAEMEREQNRSTPVTGQKKTVPPKIKSKPATTTGLRPKSAQKNLDQQQYSGCVMREQPRASIDSTKAALRKSGIGSETTTFRRQSSSMLPSRQQSGVVLDESRIRLSTILPNTSNRASISIQPGEPRDPIATTLSDLRKHPLENLGQRFKYSLTPVVEESESPIWAPSELAVPFDSVMSRRLSTARGSISYPRDPTIEHVPTTCTARGSPSYLRDPTIQHVPATVGTRPARNSVSYPRDPTIQLVPATVGTRSARNSVSYSRDPTIQLVPATVSTRSAGRNVPYLSDSRIQLEPVTPRRLSTSSAPKTPCLSSTVAAGTCNAPTVLNTTIVQNQSPFTMKTPKRVQRNTIIKRISDRSYEYASPKAEQRTVKCSDFTEKSSNECLLNPIKKKNVQHTTANINSLLNTAMTENECPSPKQQHANTKAQYDVEPQQQTTKYSQESITLTADSDTNIVNASFYEFVSNYHKQSHESITSNEILNAEMDNSQHPQPDAKGLNFLRLGVKFSDETIPRQMYADLTKIMPNLEEASSSEIESVSKSNMQRFLRNSFELLRLIMKEPPDSTVRPTETQAQSCKTLEPVNTMPAQKTSTDSANKPAQTIAGVIKKNETLSARRRGSMLPMINLGNTTTTPEASLATWIRERRTSHAIPIPAQVDQNPESLLPPKQRPIPEWRKDERPYRKLQSLIPNTDQHRVRTSTRRALQNKVIALRRSKMGRQRRLAVPTSTLNWRKFMRSSTVYANRSRKSMVRSKKFAEQYKKSLNDTDKPESIPLIFRQFLIGHIIGEGTFGTVRIAENLFKEEPCAVKMEYISRRKLHLNIENRMYKRIGRAAGFPEIFHFEQFVFNKYNALVMELLGPSLQEIYKKITRFSLKSVIQIIHQVLRRVEYIHQKGIIHRDIKPANFLVGRLGTRKQNMIYLVDFGMAKIYRNSRGKHIKYSPAAGRFGTAKYSSINAHFGREHSRRDDLEACGYMFIYFARGSLPWQGLDITNAKQKYQKIGEMKQTISLEKLCEGLPAEFIMYMKYVKRLKFSQEPDYSLLRNMFSELYFRKEYFNRREFDWSELLEKEPDPRLRQGLPGPKHSRPQLQQFYI